MIEIQVKHVETKFENLAPLKANNYVPLPIEIKTVKTAQSNAGPIAAKVRRSEYNKQNR